MTIKPQGQIEGSSYKVFSKNQLNEFVEVQTWLKTISSQSSVIYLNALKKFCEWCGKNPQELILQRDQELRNGNPNNRAGIRDLLLDFRHHMKNMGMAPKTINTYDGAIHGFFTLVLGKRGIVNIRNYKDRSVSQIKDLVPTLEELKKNCSAMKLRSDSRTTK